MEDKDSVFEPLAKAFYERDPIIEYDGEEHWFVDWEDVKDSYPATYEECMGKAVHHMYS